jgi:hypothetical protein
MVHIGYLTDIHLREAVPGDSPIARRHTRDMARLLPLCLERLRAQGVDLVLCTGDLIDDPIHPLADRDLETIGEMFDRCGVPYVVIPGNHDPRPEAFYRMLPRPERRLRIGGCELVSFYNDACDQGEDACTRADGEMGVLQGVCRDAATVSGVTVIAQHYVIYPDHSEGYPHNYRNDAAIRQEMEGANRTILSISGHYHPGIPLTEHCGVRYFAGRAFCEAPHGFYVIEIEGAALAIQSVHLLDELGGEYVASDQV